MLPVLTDNNRMQINITYAEHFPNNPWMHTFKVHLANNHNLLGNQFRTTVLFAFGLGVNGYLVCDVASVRPPSQVITAVIFGIRIRVMTRLHTFRTRANKRLQDTMSYSPGYRLSISLQGYCLITILVGAKVSLPPLI
jgi:hypothetical protein